MNRQTVPLRNTEANTLHVEPELLTQNLSPEHICGPQTTSAEPRHELSRLRDSGKRYLSIEVLSLSVQILLPSR
jgi:hypothetical protein